MLGRHPSLSYLSSISNFDQREILLTCIHAKCIPCRLSGENGAEDKYLFDYIRIRALVLFYVL